MHARDASFSFVHLTTTKILHSIACFVLLFLDLPHPPSSTSDTTTTVINRSFETFSLLYSSNNYNRNMDKLEPYIKKVDDFIAQYPSLTFYGTSNRIFLCCCVSVENFELFATSRASSKMTAALFPGARREPSKLPTENVFTIPIQHDCGLYHTTFTEAGIKAAN
jgi:hypothetical protein